ncbi:dual specificity protein phosphatase [Achlya hypogyna]|uniref:protein-tyrosine-phosphatase n=1 Tax=Achlya hypogyna TaxID=1202772 RepID=A0A1V9YSV7_ACHHY|nr:dual specificity protein phosphatase [Achlya hypogyna]
MSTRIPLLDGALCYVAYEAPLPVAPGIAYVHPNFHYANYFEDFGPFHLADTFAFCDDLSAALILAKAESQVVYACTRHGLEEQANMVCLLGCWAVLKLGHSPKEALQPFHHLDLPCFHDATEDLCAFELSILNVVEGFAKALNAQFVNRHTFSIPDYLYYEKVEHGDLNWISPKFLAFAGPKDDLTEPTTIAHLPQFFIPYFKRHNITLVVRLNDKLYDERIFRTAGINHINLPFPDGSNPSENVLEAFFTACDTTSGVVAVHCKAGLGRTGTCIAAFLMQRHGFTAKEAIGWLRYKLPRTEAS